MLVYRARAVQYLVLKYTNVKRVTKYCKVALKHWLY